MSEYDAAFRDFVVAAEARLLAFAELVTADRGRAEDLVQEGLLALYAVWPKLRDQSPEAYVRRCVVNGRISWWRRRSSHEAPVDTLPEALSPALIDVTDDSDQRLTLLAALRRLTSRERAVVALRYYGELSEAQIAAELGIAPGTVKSTAARAVAKLRVDDRLREGALQ